ncbi:hypothetical protein MRB53_040370 [Persea americana]|nr:hypothetical protein MRB53_040370 [Persea americana]
MRGAFEKPVPAACGHFVIRFSTDRVTATSRGHLGRHIWTAGIYDDGFRPSSCSISSYVLRRRRRCHINADAMRCEDDVSSVYMTAGAGRGLSTFEKTGGGGQRLRGLTGQHFLQQEGKRHIPIQDTICRPPSAYVKRRTDLYE